MSRKVKVKPLETVEAGAFKAWRLDQKGALRQAGIDLEQDASIASWIVQAPWANIMWHSYWLYICHLRPMPDNRPTKFYLDGATHELWLYTLNPKFPLEKMIAEAMPRYLTPKNFASQLILPNDEVAEQTARMAAMDVLRCNWAMVCALWRQHAPEVTMTEVELKACPVEAAIEQMVKHMTNRFLAWRLPDNFNPDAGISFTPDFNVGTPYPMQHQPIGTNLFDADQAETMVRYMVEGLPITSQPSPPQGTADDAIDFALRHCPKGDELAFLDDWRAGIADKWPDYVEWLRGKRDGEHLSPFCDNSGDMAPSPLSCGEVGILCAKLRSVHQVPVIEGGPVYPLHPPMRRVPFWFDSSGGQ